MSDINSWLDEMLGQCANLFLNSLELHVSKVKSELPDTYGYAILLGEDIDSLTAMAVTNTYSMLEKNKDCDYVNYMKFIPDEWEHWHSDVFNDLNLHIDYIYAQFRMRHSGPPDSCEYDDVEWWYMNKFYDMYLSTMLHFKESGGFSDSEFAIIWISDSFREIIDKSLLALNNGPVLEDAKHCLLDS